MKFTSLAADPTYLICAGNNGDIAILSTKTNQIYDVFKNEDNLSQ
jgi:hypothetical protein